MLLNEVFYSAPTFDTLPIKTTCINFINESNNLPLLKNLPINYNDLHKVKVRWKKSVNTFSEAFNQAFKHEQGGLRQRAIFTNGASSLQAVLDDQEPFYVFPIDGYKYTYSKEVENSSEEYKKTFDAVFEQFGNDKGQAIDIITELLRFTYANNNLHEGIEQGAEIIIYNIPFYYAVRTSKFEDYNELLELIKI